MSRGCRDVRIELVPVYKHPEVHGPHVYTVALTHIDPLPLVYFLLVFEVFCRNRIKHSNSGSIVKSLQEGPGQPV